MEFVEELTEGLALIGEWGYRAGVTTGAHPTSVTPFVTNGTIKGYCVTYYSNGDAERALPAFAEIIKILKAAGIGKDTLHKLAVYKINEQPAIIFMDAS